jgi:hypothetical protein
MKYYFAFLLSVVYKGHSPLQKNWGDCGMHQCEWLQLPMNSTSRRPERSTQQNINLRKMSGSNPSPAMIPKTTQVQGEIGKLSLFSLIF